MTAWIDSLYAYGRGMYQKQAYLRHDDGPGPCMQCGLIDDDLSYYLCWACVKIKAGIK